MHIDREHRLFAILARAASNGEFNGVGIHKGQGHAEQNFLLCLRLHSLDLTGFNVVNSAGELFNKACVWLFIGPRHTQLGNELAHQLLDVLGWLQSSGHPNLSAHGAHHGLLQSTWRELRHGKLQASPLRLQVGALNLA